jgi:hypothetical protein
MDKGIMNLEKGIRDITIQWCKDHHAALKDGGVWAVPMSCMVFRKTATGYELASIMPYMPEMSQAFTAGMDVPASPSALLEHQRREFALHKHVHELAGLTISDPQGLLT